MIYIWSAKARSLESFAYLGGSRISETSATNHNEMALSEEALPNRLIHLHGVRVWRH
jgi:hypothetical protein